MTAIAGIVCLDNRRVDPATVARMAHRLTPYGRDAQQCWQRDGVALLRTLCRITPEDRFDRQPLEHTESGRVLLFDGRLDNREELAHDLGLSRRELALMADADLVLRAALRWGTDTAGQLLGDFAIACWNARERRLWLARSPLGARPLFWHRQEGFFAFATMPKALFTIPGVPRTLCEERLYDLLTLTPMRGPESLYRDVYRVEPGQVLLFAADKVSSHRYHHFDPDREIRLPSDREYLEAFSEHLERAIACRLRAAGPIASHLSSGFDSATVTALAARQLAARDEGLIAYTAVPRAGFDGPVPRGAHADEGPAAAALAARFPNIRHHLVRTQGKGPLDGLDAVTDVLDRPPLNPWNTVWLQAIQADAGQRGVKVLLSGELGNATISYAGDTYLPSLLGRGRWLTWWREAAALKRARPQHSWRGLVRQSLLPYLPAPLWRWLRRRRDGFSGLADYSAIHPTFLAHIDARARMRKAGWDPSFQPLASGRDLRLKMLEQFDNGEYRAAANAAAGLEIRDPTADQRLVEFCLALPERQYLHAGHNRWLLRRLVEGVLPPEILEARSRGMQAADWYESTSAALPLIRAQLAEMANAPGVGEYLDLETLRDAVEHWPDGGWSSMAVLQTYQLKLLRGIAAGRFVQRLGQGNR